MSFNKQFNLTAFVKNIPSMPVRKHIMLSLAGSINHTVVSNADALATRLLAAGYDLRELDHRDINTICAVIDFQGNTQRAAMGRMMALRAEWESLLAQNNMSGVINNPLNLVKFDRQHEPMGSLANALDSACGTQKVKLVVDKTKEDKLKELNIVVTDQMRAENAEKARASAQFFADQRAQRRGFIEWVLEHIFTGDFDGEDPFLQIPVEAREMYVEKVAARLHTGINIAAANFLKTKTRDDELNIADVAILRRAQDELSAQVIAPEIRKVRKTAPKLQRMKADGTIVKVAKNKAALKATQELMDGKVSTPNKVERTNALVDKLVAEANGVTTA